MRTRIIPDGEALARARILQGLTKTELGDKAGIPHSSIVRAEQGFGVNPKTATRLSAALGEPFDHLFTIKAPGAASGAGQVPASESGEEGTKNGELATHERC